MKIMYSKIKFTISLFFILLVLKNGDAQDFHFSQYDMAPMYVSPAMTGFMSSQNRLTLKYRSQWSSVLQENEFETVLLSYDGRLCPREQVSFAFGFNLIQDQVGFPAFKTNQYMGSMAFHIEVGPNLFFSGGLQGGLLQYRWDASNLNFENQFDDVIGFDNTLSSMEVFLDRDKVNLLDLSGGVLLYSVGKPWDVGVAFHHINPFNYYSFTSTGIQDKNRTKVRWVVHGTYPLRLPNSILSLKKMTVIQYPHWQINGGVEWRKQLTKGNKVNPIANFISIGISSRLSNRDGNLLVTDAAIFTFKTDVSEKVILGISYDTNISPLRTFSNGRGGVEVSLAWEFEFDEKNKCVNCPNINSSTYGKGKWQ